MNFDNLVKYTGEFVTILFEHVAYEPIDARPTHNTL